jgi:hypothetical protein
LAKYIIRDFCGLDMCHISQDLKIRLKLLKFTA